jgi:peptide/nickel transport system permease protein
MLTLIPEFVTNNEVAGSAVWRRFFRHPGAITGAIILSIIFILALLAPLSPYDPNKSNLTERFKPPSLAHPMGTDALGRDLFTRVLYGGRISLAVGAMVVVISLSIGVTVGSMAGYFGGWVDNVFMRITDAALTMPTLLVLILLSSILREVKIPFIEKNNVLTIALVIGLLSWMTIARIIRAIFLSLHDIEYVDSARALGASGLRVTFGHILPNGIGPIIVEATLELGYAIIEESGLSFLGFGIQPPTPSWGNLLNDAQGYLTQYPWLAIFPGLMIFLTIISVNYIGDGLRDAFDPYKVLNTVGEV